MKNSLHRWSTAVLFLNLCVILVRKVKNRPPVSPQNTNQYNLIDRISVFFRLLTCMHCPGIAGQAMILPPHCRDGSNIIYQFYLSNHSHKLKLKIHLIHIFFVRITRINHNNSIRYFPETWFLILLSTS